MEIRKLQVDHMASPVGIGEKRIRVSWNLVGAKFQQAYQVKILDIDSGIFEDSKKIVSRDMYYYSEKKLIERKKYAVEVTTWDENGDKTIETTYVVTGINKKSWGAKWIDPEEKRVQAPKNLLEESRYASYLIKDFELNETDIIKAQKGAYLYTTCHGVMTIKINDEIITNHELLPGTQQYNKRLRVETLEVSKYLQKGSNRIEVSIGDGWYRGSMGNDQNKNVYGDDIALLLQMEIDGQAVVVTDETWLATQNGPIRENDFMDGENYDARLEELTDLHGVKIVDFGFDNLVANDTVPIVPHEEFDAKLYVAPNGDKILDFGQNLVGYISFDIEAKEGQRIQLVHGEVLDKDGNFTINYFQNEHKITKQEINYICKDGRNIYRPTKTYMGFRYVQVKGDVDVKPENVKAYAIYSDMAVTSSFECGVLEVNKLFENALWSMKGNFVDVPTDCPTREKSGFSGDCQAFVHTAMYLMDCYPVYAKWLSEQAAGQYEDGCVPQISPTRATPGVKEKMAGMFELDGGIGWSDSFEIVPYRMWNRYGDDSLVRQNYEGIKRWTEYEIRRASKTRFSNKKDLPLKYRKYMIDKGWMWGEWLEPGQDSTSYMKNIMLKGDPEIGTAFLYLNLIYVADMAEALKENEDAKKYRELAEKVREAYRHVYLNENGEVTEEKRQCRYVRPIAHDLMTDEEKKIAAEQLADIIEKNGNHLNTGFLTTHELCRALSENGQKKVAFDLLLQRQEPSWLYAVEKGCTTIPERWDCYTDDGQPNLSFNHYSYGAITGWLMDSVGGIKVKNQQITIEPVTDERLGYAKAIYDSPYGVIESSWKYDDNKQVKYYIEIPSNMEATIKLEGRDSIKVEAGSYDF